MRRMSNLLNYLETYRKKYHLNQTELAYLLGSSSHDKVSDYERGKRQPLASTLFDYETIFGISSRFLFAGLCEKSRKEIKERAGSFIGSVLYNKDHLKTLSCKKCVVMSICLFFGTSLKKSRPDSTTRRSTSFSTPRPPTASNSNTTTGTLRFSPRPQSGRVLKCQPASRPPRSPPSKRRSICGDCNITLFSIVIASIIELICLYTGKSTRVPFCTYAGS